MLPELDSAGVTDVHLESRESKQNTKDRRWLLDALRRQHALTPRLRMHHQPGPSEPLLWVPDAVAGAVGAHRHGDSSYLDRYSAVLTYVEI